MLTAGPQQEGPDELPPRYVNLFGRRLRVPRRRSVRLLLGGALVTGGTFGFLPVLGVWMLPLGLIVLSIDLPLVRRFRRRSEVWWGRRRRVPKGQDGAGENGTAGPAGDAGASPGSR